MREGKGAGRPAAKHADKGQQKRLTLNLPAALHTAFKGRCVLEGVTIQDKVRNLIDDYLAADPIAPGQGHPPPL